MFVTRYSLPHDVVVEKDTRRPRRNLVLDMFRVRRQGQTVCKPGSVPSEDGDGHSSGTLVAERLARPTRTATRKRAWPLWGPPSLLGLAPGGVCHATAVTGGAVRSYRTLSPLPPGPVIDRNCGFGGLLSVALSLGSPPPGVTRHRTSVEPGLSSPRPKAESGHPAVWHKKIWVLATRMSRFVFLGSGLTAAPRPGTTTEIIT